MKENLKIKIESFDDLVEAQKLLFSLGAKWQGDAHQTPFKPRSIQDVEILYVRKSVITYSSCTQRDDKPISIDELRELAREKEYLNDKFELVVTNQPLDGFILVPDGAEYYGRLSGCITAFFYAHTAEGMSFFDDNTWTQCFSSSSHELNKILWQRENKVETVKGRFLHQWAYEAFGRGEDVQIGGAHAFEYFDLNFQHSLSDFNNPAYRFRLKPQTITIGSRTIVKPLDKTPKSNDRYFIPCLRYASGYQSVIWTNDENDLRSFSRNLCHSTKEAAIDHANAILELMK